MNELVVKSSGQNIASIDQYGIEVIEPKAFFDVMQQAPATFLRVTGTVDNLVNSLIMPATDKEIFWTKRAPQEGDIQVENVEKYLTDLEDELEEGSIDALSKIKQHIIVSKDRAVNVFEALYNQISETNKQLRKNVPLGYMSDLKRMTAREEQVKSAIEELSGWKLRDDFKLEYSGEEEMNTAVNKLEDHCYGTHNETFGDIYIKQFVNGFTPEANTAEQAFALFALGLLSAPALQQFVPEVAKTLETMLHALNPLGSAVGADGDIEYITDTHEDVHELAGDINLDETKIVHSAVTGDVEGPFYSNITLTDMHGDNAEILTQVVSDDGWVSEVYFTEEGIVYRLVDYYKYLNSEDSIENLTSEVHLIDKEGNDTMLFNKKGTPLLIASPDGKLAYTQFNNISSIVGRIVDFDDKIIYEEEGISIDDFDGTKIIYSAFGDNEGTYILDLETNTTKKLTDERFLERMFLTPEENILHYEEAKSEDGEFPVISDGNNSRRILDRNDTLVLAVSLENILFRKNTGYDGPTHDDLAIMKYNDSVNGTEPNGTEPNGTQDLHEQDISIELVDNNGDIRDLTGLAYAFKSSEKGQTLDYNHIDTTLTIRIPKDKAPDSLEALVKEENKFGGITEKRFPLQRVGEDGANILYEGDVVYTVLHSEVKTAINALFPHVVDALMRVIDDQPEVYLTDFVADGEIVPSDPAPGIHLPDLEEAGIEDRLPYTYTEVVIMSPLVMRVIDKDGNQLGKDVFDREFNEIDGFYFNGDPKLLVAFDNDIEFLVTGATGSGRYKLGYRVVSNGVEVFEHVEEGKAEMGKTTSYDLTARESESSDDEIDPMILPTIGGTLVTAAALAYIFRKLGISVIKRDEETNKLSINLPIRKK